MSEYRKRTSALRALAMGGFVALTAAFATSSALAQVMGGTVTVGADPAGGWTVAATLPTAGEETP